MTMNMRVAKTDGGRAEIVNAVNQILSEKREAGRQNVTEEEFAEKMYTAGLPDPDLLIRTSGEMRVSNFLLWQISYAELVVTPTLWPDFRKAQFYAALEEYNRRHRRFGGL